MKYIIIIIIIILLWPCRNFYKSVNGIYYTSRDKKTANLMNVLRDISFSVVDKLEKKDANVLKTSLQFTTFKELNENSPRILAWNYDKGREIAIRIYDSSGNVYKANHIVRALLHELAHTLTKSNGHGINFKKKNNMLQKYIDLYVGVLINNTFVNE